MIDQDLIFRVSKNGMELESASIEQRANRNIVLAAVKQNGIALKFASENFKNDIEIVETAVKNKSGALYFASENLKGHREIVLIAIKKDGLAIEHASSKLKNDREVVLIAVAKNGLALEYASSILKNNKEVVLIAVKKNGLALEHVSSILKNDKEVVLSAVTKNGLALKFSPLELNKDEILVLKALNGRRNEKAFIFANESLRKDLDFVRKAYNINKSILKYVPNDVKDNKEFILELFQHPEPNYRDLSDRLKTDHEIAFIYLSENRSGIWDIPYILRSNKDFVKKIISDKVLITKHGQGFLPRVFKQISSKLQEDVDIIQIIKNNTTTNSL